MLRLPVGHSLTQHGALQIYYDGKPRGIRDTGFALV